MEANTATEIISSYILRLSQKRGVLQIGLQNIRSGKITRFASLEALAEHLLELQSLEPLGVARAPPEEVGVVGK